MTDHDRFADQSHAGLPGRASESSMKSSTAEWADRPVEANLTQFPIDTSARARILRGDAE
ncbi:hypothetical protein [Streptomyces canus]|uniref:hypothetical protein n=1 Tax=Streptomyces canus TaxID=58343 RepID=UPI0033ADB620